MRRGLGDLADLWLGILIGTAFIGAATFAGALPGLLLLTNTSGVWQIVGVVLAVLLGVPTGAAVIVWLMEES